VDDFCETCMVSMMMMTIIYLITRWKNVSLMMMVDERRPLALAYRSTTVFDK
jgi:hypothetical protein